MKTCLKQWSAKWQLFCTALNLLIHSVAAATFYLIMACQQGSHWWSHSWLWSSSLSSSSATAAEVAITLFIYWSPVDMQICTICVFSYNTLYGHRYVYFILLKWVRNIFWIIYSERPGGAGFKWVHPTERWLENTARALAGVGFSQHFECRIHWFESSPKRSFALIPHLGS